jgi:predicted SAM-dependent methyltransferase
MSIKVNIGCGTKPIKDWTNMDNSPAIKLANSPLKYHILKSLKLLNRNQIENIEWNKVNSIHYADATKKLAFDNNSVECIYTSHMLEHLSRDGASSFLKETLRTLEIGGVLRIAVPDLRLHVNDYILNDDADVFMNSLLVEAPKINNIKEKIQLFLSGYRHHQWMYDGKSLCKKLLASGFKNVQICSDGFTQIRDPSGLDLYDRSDDSLYVEGVK